MAREVSVRSQGRLFQSYILQRACWTFPMATIVNTPAADSQANPSKSSHIETDGVDSLLAANDCGEHAGSPWHVSCNRIARQTDPMQSPDFNGDEVSFYVPLLLGFEGPDAVLSFVEPHRDGSPMLEVTRARLIAD